MAEAAVDMLNGLQDEELLEALTPVLSERSAVLQAIVDWAVPGMAYVPTKAIVENRITGVLKSFSPKDAYGFISVPEVKDAFGCDVFVHAGQIGDLQVGEKVNFAMLLNKDQKPQAFDVARDEPGKGKGKDFFGKGKGPGAMQLPMAQMMQGKGKGGGKLGPSLGNGYYGPPPGAVWGGGGGLGPGRLGPGGGGGGGYAPKGFGAKGGKAKGKRFSEAPNSSEDMPGVTDQRFQGTIKSFAPATGFGFIACEEIQEVFGEGVDVFLHHAQLGDFQVGDTVEFGVFLSKSKKPQAMELKEVGGGKRFKSS